MSNNDVKEVHCALKSEGGSENVLIYAWNTRILNYNTLAKLLYALDLTFNVYRYLSKKFGDRKAQTQKVKEHISVDVHQG